MKTTVSKSSIQFQYFKGFINNKNTFSLQRGSEMQVKTYLTTQ